MELREAIDRVLLGEPLRSIAVAHREAVLRSLGMQSDEVSPRELWDDTGRFMNRLCRELGERHGGDRRAGVALTRSSPERASLPGCPATPGAPPQTP